MMNGDATPTFAFKNRPRVVLVPPIYSYWRLSTRQRPRQSPSSAATIAARQMIKRAEGGVQRGLGVLQDQLNREKDW
jgi:hypothetical protein